MRSSVPLSHRIERARKTIAVGESPLETIQTTAHFRSASFVDDLGSQEVSAAAAELIGDTAPEVDTTMIVVKRRARPG